MKAGTKQDRSPEINHARMLSQSRCVSMGTVFIVIIIFRLIICSSFFFCFISVYNENDKQLNNHVAIDFLCCVQIFFAWFTISDA